jgi:uncharacterized protein
LTELQRILVIDEGSPGHLVQSRGLAREMAAQSGAALAEYPVRLSLRGVFRPLLRTACGLARRGLPDGLLRLAYRLPEVPPPAAEAIVVSGGRGFCYAVSLARRTGAKLVYCGDPAPLPARWCDVVVSPQPLPGHPGALGSGMLLTEISPQRIAGQGEALRQRFAQTGGCLLVALLIGGDSRSHRYTAADWQALIDAVNRLGSQGWRWLVSTSRRTPPEAERMLQQGLQPACLVHAVWWHAAPERVVQAYLDAAQLVLVTRDSLSMLSEAVAAGKPVVVVVPRQVSPSPPIDGVLAGLLRERRLREVALTALGGLRFAPADFEPWENSPMPAYASQVIGLLGHSRQAIRIGQPCP